MDILQEAENYKWKETGEKIISNAREIGMGEIDLDFMETMRFFGIISKDQMTKETMAKVQTIYEYFKGSEDILGELRNINSQLGNPVVLGEKLDKIYSHVYSLNLEKGFEKEKEIADKRSEELLEKARKEKEAIEKTKKRETRKERYRKWLEEQQAEKMARREKLQKIKKEKEIKENMEAIKKTKQPKPPKLPEIEYA